MKFLFTSQPQPHTGFRHPITTHYHNKHTSHWCSLHKHRHDVDLVRFGWRGTSCGVSLFTLRAPPWGFRVWTRERA